MRPAIIASLVLGFAVVSLQACGTEAAARTDPRTSPSATAREELAKKEATRAEVKAKHTAATPVEAKKR